MKRILLLTFALAALAACSHPRAHINYADAKGELAVRKDSIRGETLGKIEWSEGGAIWDDCTKAAEYALKGLIEEARVRGANAIGNVRWTSTDSASPGCEKRWIFVNPTPLFVFAVTPVFMSASVEGTAYRIQKPAAGAHMLPNSEREERQFIASLAAAR